MTDEFDGGECKMIDLNAQDINATFKIPSKILMETMDTTFQHLHQTNHPQQQLRVTEDGRSLRVQTDLPHLVSLGGGRLSTAVTLLPLPEGKTMIGTTHANQPQDIVIRGAGMQDQHAYIINHDDVVTLYPLSELTSVDGIRVNKPTRLSQGCMLCFGRSSYFRFNHPIEAQRLRSNVRGASDRYSVSTSDTSSPAAISIYDTPRRIQNQSGYYDNANSCTISNNNRSVEVDRCIFPSVQHQTSTVSTPGECSSETKASPTQQLYDNVDSVKQTHSEQQQHQQQQLQSRRSKQAACKDGGARSSVKNSVNALNATKTKADLTSKCDDVTHGGSSSPRRSRTFAEITDDYRTASSSFDQEQCHSRKINLIDQKDEQDVNVMDDAAMIFAGSGNGDNATSSPEAACQDDESDDVSSPTHEDLPWNGYDNIMQLKEAIVASAAAKLASGTSGFSTAVTRRLGKASSSAVMLSSSSASLSSTNVPDATAVVSHTKNMNEQTLKARQGHEPSTAAHGQQTVTDETGIHSSVEAEYGGIRVEETFRQLHTDAGPSLAFVLRNDSASDVSSSPDSAGLSSQSTFDRARENTALSQTAVKNDVPNRAETCSVTDLTDKKNKNVSFDQRAASGVKIKESGKSESVVKVSASKFGWKQKLPKNSSSLSTVSCKEKPPIFKTPNIAADKSAKKFEKNVSEPKKEVQVKLSSSSASNSTDAVNCTKPEVNGAKTSFFKSILTRSRSPSPKCGGNESTGTISRRSPSPSPASSTKPASTSSFAKRLSDPLRVSLKQIMGEGSKSESKQAKELTRQQKHAPEKPKRAFIEEHLVPADLNDIGSKNESESMRHLGNEVDCSQMLSSVPSALTTNPPVSSINVGAPAEQSSLKGCVSIDDQHSSSTIDASTTNTARRSVRDVELGQLDDDVNVVRCHSSSVTDNPPKTLVNPPSTEPTVITAQSTSSNPWIVNLKELNLTTPNLENFRGEKVFQKGTATTSVTLPGFDRATGTSTGNSGCNVLGASTNKLDNVSRERHPRRSHDAFDVSTRNSSPIYDAVYVERSTLTTLPTAVYKSTSEIANGGNRTGGDTLECHMSSASTGTSVGLENATGLHELEARRSGVGLRLNVIDQNSSATENNDDNHTSELAEGTRGAKALTNGDACLSRISRMDLPDVNNEMTSDEQQALRSSGSGHIRPDSANGRLGGSLKNGYSHCTLSSGSSILHRPASENENSDDDGGFNGDTRKSKTALDGQHQLNMTKCATLPRKSRSSPQQPSTMPVSKSASRVEVAQPPLHKLHNIPGETYSNDTNFDENDHSRRDTLVSFVDGSEDLSASQRDLAELYRQQKTERQREQELARREKERWEKIEKMWRDFETCKAPQSTVTPSSSSCGSILESADSLPMSSAVDKKDQRYNEQDYQNDSYATKHWRKVNNDTFGSQTMTGRTPAQIDKSLDELLEEFNLTVTQQMEDSATRNTQVTMATRQPMSSSEENNVRSMGRNIIERSSARRVPGEVGANGDGITSIRPRASSCSQRPAALSGSTQTVNGDMSRSQALLEHKLGNISGMGRGLTSRSTFDLENGRNGPRQNGSVHNNMRTDVTSSGSDIEGSSSLSNSVFTLDAHRDFSGSQGPRYTGDNQHGIGIEEQLKQIQAHLRRKQVAIEALELERQRCLELERRLQDEMKSNTQLKDEGDERGGAMADRGLERGDDRDAVIFRERHRGGATAMTDDNETSLSTDMGTASMRPLTRYLPTRSKVLDLRQFVESSGHNLAHTGRHVELTSTCCRGFLYKMGGRGLRKWNRRWFVLDRSRRSLVYYADKLESTRAARGTIYFQSITDVFVDHLQSIRSPSPNVTFCVKTLERTLYLMAPTTESMRIWVDVIFTGAEGYQQFT